MPDEREMNQTAPVNVSAPPASPLFRVQLAILLALLIAANVSSLGLLPSAGFMGYVGATFLGLAFGQVSVLAAWAVFGRRFIGWRSLAPFAAGLVIAVLMYACRPSLGPIDWQRIVTYMGILWTHAALSLSVLWMMKSAGWVRPIGFGDRDRAGQFTIANLLAVTTASAMMLALFVPNENLRREVIGVGSFVIGNVVLLTAAVIACNSRLKLPARAASIVSVALVISFISSSAGLALANEINHWVYNLVQAAVLWLCLEFGRILAGRERSVIVSVEPQTKVTGPTEA